MSELNSDIIHTASSDYVISGLILVETCLTFLKSDAGGTVVVERVELCRNTLSDPLSRTLFNEAIVAEAMTAVVILNAT